MKKSNWLVLGVMAVVSVFLLWLWYFLGFNHVDDPLDLVLSIAWWVVIVLSVLVIARVERARRERIRTVYVGDATVFNSEAGVVSYAGVGLVGTIGGILDRLDYGFEREDFPESGKFAPKALVRTRTYKGGAEGDEREWEGEIALVGQDGARPFRSEKELAVILANL